MEPLSSMVDFNAPGWKARGSRMCAESSFLHRLKLYMRCTRRGLRTPRRGQLRQAPQCRPWMLHLRLRPSPLRAQAWQMSHRQHRRPVRTCLMRVVHWIGTDIDGP